MRKRSANRLHGQMNGSFLRHLPGKLTVPKDQLYIPELPVISKYEKMARGLLTRTELVASGLDKDRTKNWCDLGRFVPVAKLDTRSHKAHLYDPQQVAEALEKWLPK